MKYLLFLTLLIFCHIGYSQKSTSDQIKSLQIENADQAKKIKDLEMTILELKLDVERIRTHLLSALLQKDSVARANSTQPGATNSQAIYGKTATGPANPTSNSVAS